MNKQRSRRLADIDIDRTMTTEKGVIFYSHAGLFLTFFDYPKLAEAIHYFRSVFPSVSPSNSRRITIVEAEDFFSISNKRRFP